MDETPDETPTQQKWEEPPKELLIAKSMSKRLKEATEFNRRLAWGVAQNAG